MGKKKKILFQLNLKYIAIAGVIIVISFISSFLFNSRQISKSNELTDKINFGKLCNLLIHDFDQIEQLSGRIISYIGSNENTTTYCNNFIAENDLINQIIVVDNKQNKLLSYFSDDTTKINIHGFKYNENGFTTIAINDSSTRTCYINNNPPNKSVIIVLKVNWLNKYASYPGLSNILSLLYFDTNSNLIEQSKPAFTITANNQKQLIHYFHREVLLLPKSADPMKYAVNNGEKTGQLYLKNILGNEAVFALIVPDHHFFSLNINLLFFCLIAGIVLFVLTAFVIIFINLSYTKPLSKIVTSVKLNDSYKIDNHSVENEYELIENYIANLENQINIYRKKFEKISFENKGLENDLKLANRLQKNLFPANALLISDQNKFDIYAYSKSAYEVGGDLYDCFLIDDDHLFVAVADVSGKGIAASLYMIYAHTLLRSLVKPSIEITEIVQWLNNQLIEENISDMFVTIFMGILTLSNGKFEYCNAAHNFPCMISATGNVFELPETHGIPIGIYANRVYNSTTITLNEGDQLFIYTDGLTDTVDENGVKFSLDVLKYNLMGAWFSTATEVTERIISSIEEFRGKNKPVDDLTILTLKYTP